MVFFVDGWERVCYNGRTALLEVSFLEVEGGIT